LLLLLIPFKAEAGSKYAGDDMADIFQRAKQAKVLKPRPYNKKQVDKK
jgi:hypothetical protein